MTSTFPRGWREAAIVTALSFGVADAYGFAGSVDNVVRLADPQGERRLDI